MMTAKTKTAVAAAIIAAFWFGMMFGIAGVMAMAVVIWALRHPRIRNLETEVPDHVDGSTDH